MIKITMAGHFANVASGKVAVAMARLSVKK
jgi:hypothetical protein